jgi:hypothetical protein
MDQIPNATRAIVVADFGTVQRRVRPLRRGAPPSLVDFGDAAASAVRVHATRLEPQQLLASSAFLRDSTHGKERVRETCERFFS